jgi:hypothetical protein
MVYPVGYPGLLVIAVTSGIPWPDNFEHPLKADDTFLSWPVIHRQSPKRCCTLFVIAEQEDQAKLILLSLGLTPSDGSTFAAEQLRHVSSNRVAFGVWVTLGNPPVLAEHPLHVCW